MCILEYNFSTGSVSTQELVSLKMSLNTPTGYCALYGTFIARRITFIFALDTLECMPSSLYYSNGGLIYIVINHRLRRPTFRSAVYLWTHPINKRNITIQWKAILRF